MGFQWDFHGFNGMEWDNNNNNDNIYILYIYIYIYLGGGFNHLNNMKVSGKDYPMHYGK